jgi:hypothetical protein
MDQLHKKVDCNVIFDRNLCILCNKTFNTPQGLQRHMLNKKQHPESTSSMYINTIKEMKKVNKNLKKTDIVAKNINANIKVIEKVENNLKQTLIKLESAINKFVHAPILVKFENYELFGQNYEVLVNVLMRQFEKNILHEYVGDVIINYYKKDNVEQQSFWNTNDADFTYIVRDVINTSNISKHVWLVDDGARKIIDKIINPITNYLNSVITKHAITYEQIYGKNSFYNISEYNQKIKIYEHLTSQQFINNIIKYITPSFSYFTVDNCGKVQNNIL